MAQASSLCGPLASWKLALLFSAQLLNRDKYELLDVEKTHRITQKLFWYGRGLGRTQKFFHGEVKVIRIV